MYVYVHLEIKIQLKLEFSIVKIGFVKKNVPVGHEKIVPNKEHQTHIKDMFLDELSLCCSLILCSSNL